MKATKPTEDKIRIPMFAGVVDGTGFKEIDETKNYHVMTMVGLMDKKDNSVELLFAFGHPKYKNALRAQKGKALEHSSQRIFYCAKPHNKNLMPVSFIMLAVRDKQTGKLEHVPGITITKYDPNDLEHVQTKSLEASEIKFNIVRARDNRFQKGIEIFTEVAGICNQVSTAPKRAEKAQSVLEHNTRCMEKGEYDKLEMVRPKVDARQVLDQRTVQRVNAALRPHKLYVFINKAVGELEVRPLKRVPSSATVVEDTKEIAGTIGDQFGGILDNARVVG